MEQKTLISIVKMVTVAAVLLVSILLISLIYNLVMIPGQEKRNKALEAELANNEAYLEYLESRIQYSSSDIFIERYARAYLGLLAPGEVLFVGVEE